MKLDYDAGRPMELDAIYGEPLRQAYAKHTEMPEVSELHQLLITHGRGVLTPGQA